MTYQEQLRSVSWQRKRFQIFTRDNWTCQNCFSNDESKSLHVHHKYYAKGKMAWQYPDDDLVTLCSECHKNTHGIRYQTDSVIQDATWQYINELRKAKTHPLEVSEELYSDQNYRLLQAWEDIDWYNVPEKVKGLAIRVVGQLPIKPGSLFVKTGHVLDFNGFFGGGQIGIVTAARQIMKWELF